MNPRLISYLRSLGLNRDATPEQADDYFRSLRGVEATIANLLNHNETDPQARTNCDVAIRALGYEPANPSQLLPAPAETNGAQRNQEATPPAENSAGDREAIRSEVVAEQAARITAIRTAAEPAGTPREVLDELIGDLTITADQARQRILEDYRERNRTSVPDAAPAGHSRDSVTGNDRNSLAAALMMRNGIHDPTVRWYEHNEENGLSRFTDRGSDPEVGRAVDRGHVLSGMSMVELTRRALALGGVRCEPTVRSIALAMRSGTVSTADVSNIFTQTFGALMLQGFEEAEDSTAGWTAERDNPNFFSIPRVRMGKVNGLEKLGVGGTAQDVTFDDKAENTKVNRYAGKFCVDEQDLINDTFGALQSMTPQEMGAAARRLRPDLVYAILLSNPNMRDGVALFHAATHGNLSTSTSLTFGGLQTLLTSIATQQENSVNLNLRGRYLIVPEALRWTAADLVAPGGAVVVTGSSDLVRTSTNTVGQEGMQVRADSRLDNGVTDPDSGSAVSGSATDWYVSCEGSKHTVEVSYLRGSSRSPEIRSFVRQSGQFGIDFDVHQDIGAKALSWEGIAKAEA